MPQCSAPDVRNNETEVIFSPVKDKYAHGEEIIFSCVDPEKGVSSHRTLRCVRNSDSNGTVYGEWDRTVPSCQVIR